MRAWQSIIAHIYKKDIWPSKTINNLYDIFFFMTSLKEIENKVLHQAHLLQKTTHVHKWWYSPQSLSSKYNNTPAILP